MKLYAGISVKLVLNMHDLNNERAEEIRRIPIIYPDRDDIFEEAVAVSGVMVKHWHFVYMVTLGGEQGINFCGHCKKFEAIRVPSEKVDEKEAKGKKTKSEYELINGCAGEDVHGFLRAKPVLRRESLAKFSWMLPLFNENVVRTFGLPTPFRVVQHSRNIREIPPGAPEEVRQAQMPYPRSYGSGIYGFVSSLDLEHIGYSFTDESKKLDGEEIKKRRKVAVQAYVPMLTGAIGGSLARALPIADVLEVITIFSRKPIPIPVHPMYPDYINENINLYESVSKVMGSKIEMCVWSKEEVESKEDDLFSVNRVKKPADGFLEILQVIDEKKEKEKKGK